MLIIKFRRRRKGKTDYRQRLSLLKSGKHRLVVRKYANSIRIQFVKSDGFADVTEYECTSKILKKFGWQAHGGSVSSSYLCGLVAGFEARKKNISEVVLDIGRHISVKGSSLYAAALGVKDSGIRINIGKKIVPTPERISGRHIAEFAKILKKDRVRYEKQFSAYLKSGFDPERIPEHFEEVKNKIISEYGSGIKADNNEIEDEEWEDVE
jgi:large subunit ribosomal protein L18